MADTESTGGLTDAQRSSFETNGFLAIDHLLEDVDLRPLEEEYDQLLDRIACQLHVAGKIPSTSRA